MGSLSFFLQRSLRGFLWSCKNFPILNRNWRVSLCLFPPPPFLFLKSFSRPRLPATQARSALSRFPRPLSFARFRAPAFHPRQISRSFWRAFQKIPRGASACISRRLRARQNLILRLNFKIFLKSLIFLRALICVRLIFSAPLTPFLRKARFRARLSSKCPRISGQLSSR